MTRPVAGVAALARAPTGARHRGDVSAVSGHAVRLATVLAMFGVTAGYLAAAPIVSAGTSRQVGQVLVVTALVLGLPHGAADVDTEALRGASTIRWLAGMAAYAGAAGAAVAAWTQWPTATVLALLLIAAVHFGVSDAAAAPSPYLRILTAIAGGLIPVAVPVALHGPPLVSLLDALSAGHGHTLVTAARAGVPAAGLAAAALVVAAARRRDWLSCGEPLAVLAVFVALPPLLAFAAYYALWHCTRQVLPTLTNVARRHGLTLRHAAARYLVRTAVPSLVVLIAATMVLTQHRIPLTAVAIITVLSLTVPHAATTALQAHLTRTRAQDGRVPGAQRWRGSASRAKAA
ncbi:hypothetical protein MMAD_28640 [Mycolicibacterium madagascariense]|uniref:Beta-carotene 15,15'-dioxygenase n=1 Tax=Mycolicibacterium madagascariense TaxID=212765 RepID=A0A7I7XHA3_9MYCO|nr:Brp/Blh family beta-carotene 15,15'-dioxygenase [Mycolicibacterium madagascariense]MCV7014340.1 Brp/Blh family beta-carotene 15,15'-dioxygenase [Mycolicibacterium madagascariense]BBZ28569.1 hypothetical protein MMAD_28640 [Mycolicibacterium madagascariense]